MKKSEMEEKIESLEFDTKNNYVAGKMQNGTHEALSALDEKVDQLKDAFDKALKDLCEFLGVEPFEEPAKKGFRKIKKVKKPENK